MVVCGSCISTLPFPGDNAISSSPQDPACARCALLPASLSPEIGTLYLAPPLPHTTARLAHYLRAQSLPFTTPFPGIVAISLATRSLHDLATGLTDLLSAGELRDTQSLILPDHDPFTLAHLSQVHSLHTLLARIEGNGLIAMLREHRLTTHFQPIVSCAHPATVFAYECLMRGIDPHGQLVPPLTILRAARDAELLFYLDRAARLTAVRESVVHAITTTIFINFNPSAVYDPANCLNTTINAINAAGIAPGRIVFEVVESDEVTDTEHLLRILAVYRQAGFRIALDDMGAGYSSLNLLGKLHPDFVKLDREVVRDLPRDSYKAAIATKLLELANALGIPTIAEGIETPAEWHWLRDHGATYAQGYLFARPASPPPMPRLPVI